MANNRELRFDYDFTPGPATKQGTQETLAQIAEMEAAIAHLKQSGIENLGDLQKEFDSLAGEIKKQFSGDLIGQNIEQNFKRLAGVVAQIKSSIQSVKPAAASGSLKSGTGAKSGDSFSGFLSDLEDIAYNKEELAAEEKRLIKIIKDYDKKILDGLVEYRQIEDAYVATREELMGVQRQQGRLSQELGRTDLRSGTDQLSLEKGLQSLKGQIAELEDLYREAQATRTKLTKLYREAKAADEAGRREIPYRLSDLPPSETVKESVRGRKGRRDNKIDYYDPSEGILYARPTSEEYAAEKAQGQRRQQRVFGYIGTPEDLAETTKRVEELKAAVIETIQVNTRLAESKESEREAAKKDRESRKSIAAETKATVTAEEQLTEAKKETATAELAAKTSTEAETAATEENTKALDGQVKATRAKKQAVEETAKATATASQAESTATEEQLRRIQSVAKALREKGIETVKGRPLRTSPGGLEEQLGLDPKLLEAAEKKLIEFEAQKTRTAKLGSDNRNKVRAKEAQEAIRLTEAEAEKLVKIVQSAVKSGKLDEAFGGGLFENIARKGTTGINKREQDAFKQAFGKPVQAIIADFDTLTKEGAEDVARIVAEAQKRIGDVGKGVKDGAFGIGPNAFAKVKAQLQEISQDVAKATTSETARKQIDLQVEQTTTSIQKELDKRAAYEKRVLAQTTADYEKQLTARTGALKTEITKQQKIETPQTDTVLSKTAKAQKELSRLTEAGIRERVGLVQAELEQTVDLAEDATRRRKAILDAEIVSEKNVIEDKARVRQESLRQQIAAQERDRSIAAAGDNQAGATKAITAQRRLQLEILAIENEKNRKLQALTAARVATEQKLESEKTKFIEQQATRAVRAAEVLAKSGQSVLANLLSDIKTLQSVSAKFTESFNLVKAFSTQGFGGGGGGFGGGGGGGNGPFDFGKFGDGIGKLTTELGKLEDGLPPIAQGFLFAAKGAFEYLDVIKSLTDSALEFAKNQRQLGDALDLSAKSIAAFTLGFTRAGQPVFTLDIALSSLAQKAKAAAEGDEKLARAFDAMGVSVTNANGELRQTDAILEDIAANFKANDRAQAAGRVEIFGIFGQRAVGSTLRNFKQLQEEAKATGLLLSQQAETALLDYYGSVTRIQAAVQGLINTIGAAAAPKFQEFNEVFLKLFQILNLNDPAFVKGIVDSVGALLAHTQAFIEQLSTLKDALDELAVPINLILSFLTGEAFAGGAKNLESITGAIGRILSLTGDLLKILSLVGNAFNALNYPLKGILKAYELVFGGAPENVTAKQLREVEASATRATEQIKNLGTQLAIYKRQSDALGKRTESDIADINERRQTGLDEVQRRTEEEGLDPVTAAKLAAEINRAAQDEVIAKRQEAYDLEKKQVEELTGLSFEEVRRRLDTEEEILSAKQSGLEAERKAAVEIARIRFESVKASTDKLKAELKSQVSRPSPQQLQTLDTLEAEQRLAQARLDIESANLRGIIRLRGKASETFRTQLQEQVNQVEEAGKRISDATREGVKKESAERAAGLKLAEEQRQVFYNKEVTALETAYNKQRGIIAEEEARKLKTKSDAQAENLALDIKQLEKQKAIIDGFLKGAELKRTVPDVFLKEEIKERIRLNQELMATETGVSDEHRENARLQIELDKQRLAGLKDIPIEYDQIIAKIRQLEAERAATSDSVRQAEIDADIAAQNAILKGRDLTQRQITENQLKSAKLREEITAKEAKTEGEVIEARLEALRRLAAQERANAELIQARIPRDEEAAKKASGLSQAEIEAGKIDVQLTRIRIDGQIQYLRAKLSAIDAQIAELRLINKAAPEIKAAEAERLQLETQLNQILRTRLELLDRAAAKEREASTAGVDGARSRVKSYAQEASSLEELQQNLIDKIQETKASVVDAAGGIGGAIADIAKTAAESINVIASAGLDKIDEYVAEAFQRYRDAFEYNARAPIQIAGLFELQLRKAEDVLKAALARQSELQAQEAKRAAEEAAEQYKQAYESISDVIKDAADSEADALENLNERIADINRERLELEQEHAQSLLDIQKENAERLAEFDEAETQKRVDRERAENRERLQTELEFQTDLARLRQGLATDRFSSASSGILTESGFRVRERELTDQVTEAQKRLTEARKAGDVAAIKEAQNALKALEIQRELINEERKAAEATAKKEAERQDEISKLLERAARGELNKDELDAEITNVNARYQLEKDFIRDRLQLIKDGNKDLIPQLEAAYAEQRKTLQRSLELERNYIRESNRLKAEFRKEDERLEEADRINRRNKLIADNAQRLQDEKDAYAERKKELDRQEGEVRAEYQKTLNDIRDRTRERLAELKTQYGTFFDDIIGKIGDVSKAAKDAIATLGDLGNATTTATTPSGPNASTDGNQSSSTGGNPSAGPTGPTEPSTGPTASSGSEDPTKAPKGGNPASAPGNTPAGGGLGNSVAIADAFIARTNSFERDAARGSLKSALYNLDILHKGLDQGSNPILPSITKADYDRALAAVKAYWSLPNVWDAFRRRRITASRTVAVLGEMVEAGFVTQSQAQPFIDAAKKFINDLGQNTTGKVPKFEDVVGATKSIAGDDANLIYPKNPLQSDTPAGSGGIDPSGVPPGGLGPASTPIGTANLTSKGRKIDKVGQKAKPLGKLPLGKKPVFGGPGPTQKPKKVTKGNIPKFAPPDKTPNIAGSTHPYEAAGVARIKAEFKRIYDFIQAGTHTPQEIANEINLAAQLLVNLANKGLFKEPGGISLATYRAADDALRALARGDAQTFTNSPFYNGTAVPKPGDTTPAFQSFTSDIREGGLTAPAIPPAALASYSLNNGSVQPFTSSVAPSFAQTQSLAPSRGGTAPFVLNQTNAGGFKERDFERMADDLTKAARRIFATGEARIYENVQKIATTSLERYLSPGQKRKT